ncbi:anti-sigma factor family protein [Nakamurella sp. GG22]
MSDLCRSDAAYVLGALSPADRHAYEDHLRGCDACQASVQRIAGLPGLLALTSAEAVEDPGPPVPETLLPSLIARVRSAQRRRRWATGGLLAAAAAAVLVISGVLIVHENTEDALYEAGGGTTAGATTSPGTVPAVPDEQTPMIPVVPGPMTASLELTDKKWGTAITVICSYTDTIDSSVSYDLAVIDTQGQHSPAGSWRAVPGATARVAVATAVPRNRIASLEVLLPDGRTILRSSP